MNNLQKVQSQLTAVLIKLSIQLTIKNGSVCNMAGQTSNYFILPTIVVIDDFTGISRFLELS